jgi:hypothetical protein
LRLLSSGLEDDVSPEKMYKREAIIRWFIYSMLSKLPSKLNLIFQKLSIILEMHTTPKNNTNWK